MNGSYKLVNGAYSVVKKRSIVIGGHKTSVSLEIEFWDEFGTMARQRDMTFSQLVSQIDLSRKPSQNLSSALRVYILNDLMHRVRASAKATSDAHAKLKAIVAGHEASSRVREGLAPIGAVIAKGRANA